MYTGEVEFDGLGRVTNRTVKVGGYSFNTIIGYTDGAYGTNSTTGLLRHMFQGNENFVYYYDNVGNISYMYRTGKYTGYAYDALGQLIRVNDQTDTTSGATGTTWTYEYDRGGNIISKSRYAYTTGVLGTALETIVYGYGDYNWMDKMTHYNYLGVSYDDIGNPTSFNGWTCTWEKGRQLKQMTDNSVNTIYYKYNADGLRVQKRKVTIYGSDVTTNYILHGKNIVHMTQGTDTLHFWYDAQGRPAIVEYNGTKYAYIHNLQGDIVGIIDSTGAEVVQYTYDAWGKVLSTAGTMASSLGTVQPFRYRGYVYDVETGLYYLRSRYYNPEWGRFINADILISNNSFMYCMNNPIIFEDVNGKHYNSSINSWMNKLKDYLETNKFDNLIDDFAYAVLTHDHVNVRKSSYISKDNIITEISKTRQVNALFVKKKFEFEGYNVPNNAQDHEVFRIWFEVYVFLSNESDPIHGYISADYVYPEYGLGDGEYVILGRDVNLRKQPNRNHNSKIRSICGPYGVVPLGIDSTSGDWFICCTRGDGLVWVYKKYVHKKN